MLKENAEWHHQEPPFLVRLTNTRTTRLLLGTGDMFKTISFQHYLWLYWSYEAAREPLRAGINIECTRLNVSLKHKTWAFKAFGLGNCKRYCDATIEMLTNEVPCSKWRLEAALCNKACLSGNLKLLAGDHDTHHVGRQIVQANHRIKGMRRYSA